MANFTTTTSAVFIPEVWSAKTLIAAEKKLVAAKRVSRYDADVSGKGDTIHIPIVSNFSAARTKAADTDVTLDALTESEKVIDVSTHVYVAFAVEDRLAKQSGYDLTSYYTEKAGYAVAQKVDTDLLALYSDFTTTDAGSYEGDVTAATMVSALSQLASNDVPMEDRSAIITATQMAKTLNVAEFVRADWQGEYDRATRVQTGPESNHLLGTLYGVPVYYSTNVATTAGTTTQVHNVVFHKEAWALAMQIAPRVQMQYKIEKLADIVVTDCLYGVLTTRATFGVELRSTT